MYHHVVLLRYEQDVGEDVHCRIHDYAARIDATLDGILNYAYCRNLNSKSADYPYAIIATFESVESFAAYAEAPLHQQLVDFSMQYISDIVIHDFESTATPVGSLEGDETWRTTRDRLKVLMSTESYESYYG